MTPWLTDEEAIEYLKLKAKTAKVMLHRWIRKEKLKATKPRGCKFYRHKEEWLDAFLMGK